MALPVDVHSLQPLRDVRSAFGRFGDDARNALAAADMEITRMVDWLTNERRLYWHAEIRRRREKLSQAKSELFRKRTSQMFGQDASLSEPRENLRQATARLELAEAMLERVRKWVGPLQHAVGEYRSAAQPLGDALDADLKRTMARLERMIVALEQYAAETAAPLPRNAPARSANAPEATSAAETPPAGGETALSNEAG